MKQMVKIFGLIGSILLAIGIIFKMMHWPGASIAVLLGSVGLALYSLLFMNEKLKTAVGGTEKTFVILFGISGILMCFSFLFKVMHWPGAAAFIYSFFVAYTLTLLLGMAIILQEKDKEKQYKYINILIWLIGGVLMLAFPTIVRFLT